MESKQDKYSVSVVIPAFNSEKHIGRAIDSVLAQTLVPEEIIVVDDGSTDDTAQVVSLYGGRVEYTYQENMGASTARNAGIKEASGRWIAFLDADDEWLPEKLETQMELLKANPDLVWATCNYFRHNESSDQRSAHVSAEKAVSLPIKGGVFDSFFAAFNIDAWGCTDTMLIERRVLFEGGLFDEEIDFTEDLDMWFRVGAMQGAIGYCAEPLAVYHIDTPGSLVKKKGLRNLTVLSNFLLRNLEFAEKYSKRDQFAPCATILLRRWIRAMLFAGHGRDVRLMVKRFGELLPPGYRLGMKVLAIWPGFTAGCLRMGARIIKRLRGKKHISRSKK